MDERRNFDTRSTRAGRVSLRETIVQQEGRLLPIRNVRNRRIRLEAYGRLTYELVERNPGVVDPVATADSCLVSQSIGKAQPRAPGVVVRLFKGADSGAARSLASKDHGTRKVPGARIERVGIEGGIPVLGFGARKLVIKAQPQGYGQAASRFVLVVDPRSHVSFVEHRMERNGLGGRMNLTEQERGK